MTKINECGHPNQKHYAKGMCHSCYDKTPSTKAKLLSYKRTPKSRAKQKEYEQRPDIKAKKKAYYSTPSALAKFKKYRDKLKHTPEYKAAKYSSGTGVSKEAALPWFQITEQGRTCWLCGSDPIGSMNLDHDHDTLTVRGWAHRSCNLAEGYIKDSPSPQYLLSTLLSIYGNVE